MKKVIALLLCLLLTVGVFAACGSDKTENEESSESVSATDELTKTPESDSGAPESDAATMDPSDPYVNDALFPDLD